MTLTIDDISTKDENGKIEFVEYPGYLVCPGCTTNMLSMTYRASTNSIKKFCLFCGHKEEVLLREKEDGLDND